MDRNTTNGGLNEKHFSRKQEADWLEPFRKLHASGKLILTACGIGAVLGTVIVLGTPHEYTASTLVAHESSRKRSSSAISALADMGDDITSSIAADKDAIYPFLYRDIVNSTPFLLRLSDIEVHRQKDSAAIPLSLYLTEHQKRPWWSAVTSVPSRLIGWGMSLFSGSGNEPEAEKIKAYTRKTPLRLTRKEAAIIGAIASRISVELDKKKRTIALSVVMQDPQVAATVADSVQTFLREFVTEYRTGKARRMLKYNEMLCLEAQAGYYAAQDAYARYADANQSLVMLTSRTELARLRNEMKLALATYNQLEKQVRAAKARVEKVIPVYTVIQPVMVPLRPSKPNKWGILAKYILLGGAGSVGWVLFAKGFIRKVKENKTACKPMITDD